MRLLLIATAALSLGTPVAAAEPVTGRWLTEEKTGVVEIAPCGANLCGTIVRIIGSKDVSDLRDANNPNAALRNRRIVGLPILTDFTRRDGAWRGRIYDPNSGKSYRSIIGVGANGRLEVKGCIGPFCQTQIWTRAR